MNDLPRQQEKLDHLLQDLEIEADELSIIRKKSSIQLEEVDYGTIGATPYGKSFF